MKNSRWQNRQESEIRRIRIEMRWAVAMFRRREKNEERITNLTEEVTDANTQRERETRR